MDKNLLKKLASLGIGIGKPFLPPMAGGILDEVKKSILDKNDGGNTKALEALAARVHDLEESVKILVEYITKNAGH